ncbi:hypothetical protein LTR10_007567 [Elasticomyces elasticus]|nr:hypothetical protein LTR10_007567 [Elasticomyces elasticus]KAK4970571.1 hypothetical protein LTR42_007546 [Elasticomyces elasticus]
MLFLNRQFAEKGPYDLNDDTKVATIKAIATQYTADHYISEGHLVVEPRYYIGVVPIKWLHVPQLELLATTLEGSKPLPATLKEFVNRLKIITTNEEYLNAIKCDTYDALLSLEHVHVVPQYLNEDENSTGYYPVKGSQVGTHDGYERFFKRSILVTQASIDKLVDLGQDFLGERIPDQPVDLTARELEVARASQTATKSCLRWKR